MRRLLRGTLVVLDVALVVAFVLAYAARYVHPRTGWWLELIALAMPYLTIALAVVTPMLVAAGRPRMAALHGLLLALALVRYVPIERLRLGGAPDDGEALTVLTLNTPRQWGRESEMVPPMVALMRAVRPELIALQEAPLVFDDEGILRHARPDVRTVLDALAYETVPLPDRERRVEQPVLGQVPLLGQRVLVIDRPDWPSPTQVVRTRFLWQGREAVLYNLHLRSFGMRKPWDDEAPRDLLRPAVWRSYLHQYRAAYVDRAWEVDTLRAMIERETLPTLVVGDFNSTMHSWAYAHLAEGFQDAFRHTGRGWGATYHDRFPLVRIDFVLAGPEWQVLDAHVPDVDVSDHRPVVASLRWREGASQRPGGS